MYMGGTHAIKLICFSLIHVSFIKRGLSQNPEGERRNDPFLPTAVILGEVSDGRYSTEAESSLFGLIHLGNTLGFYSNNNVRVLECFEKRNVLASFFKKMTLAAVRTMDHWYSIDNFV